MTITVPAQLEKAVEKMAAERNVSVDELVQEVLEQFLRGDARLRDELQAWQEIRDEAADVVEEATQ